MQVLRNTALIVAACLAPLLVRAGWLGISLIDAPGDEGSAPGVAVADVRKGGPAAEAGLRPGDELLTLDGQTVHLGADFVERIASAEPGEPLDVRVRRNGRVFPVRVVPKAMPAYMLYYRQGLAHASEKRYHAALAELTRAMELAPDDYECPYRRGLIHSTMRNLDAAIADFSAAVSLNADFAPAYLARAHAHRRKGNPVRATADQTAAARAYLNRGLAHASQGEYTAAVAQYDRAAGLDTRYAALACYNRAIVREKQGRLADAVASLTDAIRRNPRFGAAYLKRGILRARQGDTKEACRDWWKTIEMDPMGEAGRAARARLAELQGKH